MTVEAVIFDWGGTLAEYANVDLLDMWRLAADHLAPHVGQPPEALTMRLAAVEERMWARTATDARASSLADLLREAAEEIDADVAEAILEETGVRYLDTWTPHIRHFDDAAATLAALKARGLRVGLLSNTHWPPAYHDHFLRRDGLAAHIDARCYTSEMAFMKPHPQAFRVALEALGVRAEHAVFVGDRLYDDVHGAQRVGMRAIHRPNPGVPDHPTTPDATISALADLLPVLDRWA